MMSSVRGYSSVKVRALDEVEREKGDEKCRPERERIRAGHCAEKRVGLKKSVARLSRRDAEF